MSSASDSSEAGHVEDGREQLTKLTAGEPCFGLGISTESHSCDTGSEEQLKLCAISRHRLEDIPLRLCDAGAANHFHKVIAANIVRVPAVRLLGQQRHAEERLAAFLLTCPSALSGYSRSEFVLTIATSSASSSKA